MANVLIPGEQYATSNDNAHEEEMPSGCQSQRELANVKIESNTINKEDSGLFVVIDHLTF
jgi:hypothetical protein